MQNTMYNINHKAKVNQFSFYGIFILVAIIIFPSVSFFFRYSFEFFILLLVLLKYGINKNFFKTSLAILSFLLLCSVIHFFETQSPEEIYDLIRITTPLLIFTVSKNITNNDIAFVLKILIFINIVGIYYFEIMEDTFGLSSLIHTRDLEESYGRHSGFFLNVSTLGAFSTISIIYSIVRVFTLKKDIFLEIIFILLAGYLLLESGSKTGMGLVLIFGSAFIVFNAVVKQNFISIIISTLLSLLFLLSLPFLIDTYYQLEKLFMVFDRGLLGVSSFAGRIMIWTKVLELFFSSPIYFIFGIPKEIINVVTTTYDSDYVWILSRYGVLALLSLLFFILVTIMRMMSINRRSNDLHPNLWCFLLICSYSFFVGIFTTPQLFSLSCLILAPLFSSKYLRDS